MGHRIGLTTGLLLALAVLLLFVACAGGKRQPVMWGYEGSGAPEHWASLSDEYAACAGEFQSPIDIAGYKRGDAPPLRFSYNGLATSIRKEGRFVHVEHGPGNTLGVGRATYDLKSAHFHVASEHLVEGAGFAAELHLVHADSEGSLAVVALLFVLGAPSPVVQQVLDVAPPAAGSVIEGLVINSGGYVPGGPGYFGYVGSKTTPPCDGPVDWFVMRDPGTMSQEQVKGLLEISGGPNNRPVQPTADRVIRVK